MELDDIDPPGLGRKAGWFILGYLHEVIGAGRLDSGRRLRVSRCSLDRFGLVPPFLALVPLMSHSTLCQREGLYLQIYNGFMGCHYNFYAISSAKLFLSWLSPRLFCFLSAQTYMGRDGFYPRRKGGRAECHPVYQTLLRLNCGRKHVSARGPAI